MSSMVTYWYEKGGIEKLQSQYPDYFELPIIKVALSQMRAMEALILQTIIEGEPDENE